MSESWAHGTTLGYSATVGGGSYTLIGTIVDIDAKVLKRAAIDTTLLTSPSNTKTKRAGMCDGDAFKLKIQYHKTLHALLLTLMQSDTPNRDFQFTLTDGSTYLVTCFISEFAEVPKATNDNVYENDISLMPIGPGVFTAGT